MPRYDAYLVRVWRGDLRDGARWACRLEHLPDGGHRRFAHLEDLLVHLRGLLAGDAGEPGTRSPTDPPRMEDDPIHPTQPTSHPADPWS